MKKHGIRLLTTSIVSFIGLGTAPLLSEPYGAKAAAFDSPNYYSLLATAIDASDSNAFEENQNPQIFDSLNGAFINAVSARKDVDTYANSIDATSAYGFSQKYSKAFSTSLDTSVKVYDVTTDISGKFDTNANTENWKQQIENYQYYYWFAQKYIVNIDWKDENITNALSPSFKRELGSVNSVVSAKSLLRKYGTHVYDTYVLGGKLEISKYFTQDASYELSETEKSAAASLNVIVDTAKVDAKVSGSVTLSTYESNSSSSSSYYSKLSYHSYGGDVNGAATASDLFQYKTQFGTGTASGFLYEAWTNSFNKDGVALKVVSAKNAVPVWDILNSTTYSVQIPYLKKAFDNMCYESYAKKCASFGVPCEYIDSLSYKSKGTEVSITPYSSTINLPEDSTVKIKLSKLVTDNFESSDYSLRLSSDSAATLDGDTLTIKSGTIGRKFDIELLTDGLAVYTLNIVVRKESLSGGYGTAQQPYLINSKQDLMSVLNDLSDSNHFYQLSKDIDLGGEKLSVGGSGTSSSFQGTFDGNGYVIKNCTIKANSFNNGFPYIGLFGRNDGTIKNLVLDNVICLSNGLTDLQNSNVNLVAGILTGLNSGVISNCQIKNSAIRIASNIEKGDSSLCVGGVAGYSDGYIEFSSFTNGNVYGIGLKGNGKAYVGGIVGLLAGSKISESYVSSSKINAYNGDETDFALGGVVGNMTTRISEDTSTIKSKISMCLVYGVNANKEGNTFGYIAGSESQGKFSNCYYKAQKEQSVAGGQKSNCFRKDDINLSFLPSVFQEKWVDGDDGPVLAMHKN